MATPDPKRYGYKLPLEALGGVCIRVSIEFPDKLEYRAAFNGAINMLGKWFQWDHTQADYQDIPDLNVEVAQVWSGVLAAATWEDCVTFCEQLIACLETDGDTQDALAELIRTNPAISEALSQWTKEHPTGTIYPKELPLPPEVTEGNILPPNPGCDPDLLFGQCIGIVQTANRMVEDFLETWETYNNGGEVLSDIVQAIPLVAGVADILGIPGIIEYANDLIDAIGENYSADYTLEYEQQLACEIFCAAKADCVVSLDMLANIMNTRIGNALTLDNGVELMISLIDMDIAGFNVADLYIAAFFNMLKVANLILPITWGIEGYLRTIATFNTPDDDWETLCEDCPPADFWTLSGEDNPFPIEAYGTIISQTTSHIEVDAALYLGIYRIKLHGIEPATLSGVTYTSVTYYTDPGGLGIPMPANGNTQQDIFMASNSPFSLAFSWT